VLLRHTNAYTKHLRRWEVSAQTVRHARCLLLVVGTRCRSGLERYWNRLASFVSALRHACSETRKDFSYALCCAIRSKIGMNLSPSSDACVQDASRALAIGRQRVVGVQRYVTLPTSLLEVTIELRPSVYDVEIPKLVDLDANLFASTVPLIDGYRNLPSSDQLTAVFVSQQRLDFLTICS